MRTLLTKLLLLLHVIVYATPDDGIREYDVLVGYNESSYYSIKTIHYPTGNYFIMIDSSFLVERNLTTGKVTSRILLRAAKHIDNTTFEDWETIEYKNKNFNYSKFLADKKVKYLYPEIYQNTNFKPLRLRVDIEGLKLIYRDDSILLETLEYISLYVPWIESFLENQLEHLRLFPYSGIEFVSISNVVADDNYLFITINGEIDPEKYQSVVVMESKKYEKLKNEIVNRKSNDSF
ncbi:MAG: hypothetical protein JXB49_34855 [Bacteroidales bacterium]|nr:hypothetical protein [Bacteroidales bacterium]